jgi:glycosyltransferase involved in cell wall biosynthesis
MPPTPSSSHAALPEREYAVGPNLDNIMNDLDDSMNALRPIELPPLPENPLVSVLVANYNYARFIGEAIQSVLDQTYGNFEVVICDDGSTDNSVEVIEGFARRDSRVHLVRKANGGMGSALSAAYRASNGEIICLLDSDDYYLPEKLEVVVEAFRTRPGSGYLQHRLFRVDAAGRRRGVYPLLWSLPSGWLAPYVMRTGGELPIVATCSGLCVRRAVADLIFPLAGRFRRNADAVVSGLAALMTPVLGVNAPLSEWREHGANLSSAVSAGPSITPGYVERELKVQKNVWALQQGYLESVNPGAVCRFAPAEKRPLVLCMTYVLARLRRDINVKATYGDLVGNEGFNKYPFVSRLFWRVSVLLPLAVFRMGVSLLWGQSRLKQWVALAKWRTHSTSRGAVERSCPVDGRRADGGGVPRAKIGNG